MEQFSYLDIYATEGFSFLLIVGYLVILIFFAKTLFSGDDRDRKDRAGDNHA